MDTLPVELYQTIFGFLSVKEKITIREVSFFFESQIKMIMLLIYRLENNLKMSHSIEIKSGSDMIQTINNNFLMYTDYTQSGIHSLFRIDNHQYNRCIDFCCREKRLGNIYFSKKSQPIYNTSIHIERYMDFYSKRKIPYCLNCYTKWS